MRVVSLTTAFCLLATGGAAASVGQNPFSPAVVVNERAITNYEVDQREKFLEVLSGPGDHHDEAVKALIDDRLRLDEATRLGIKLTDAEIKAGEDEFASRAKVSTQDFVAALAKGGVDEHTFSDFVSAGQAWRKVVSGLIAPRVTVTDADAEDAQTLSLAHGTPRILLSELILPATPDYIAQTTPLAEQLSKTLHGDAAFSEAAKKYSVSQSAPNGGKLDWMPASNLPQTVLTAVVALSPGQVTAPIAIPNALVLFELRGLEDAAAPPPSLVSVDYMTYLIPGGQSAEAQAEAARVRARVSTCGDLFGVAKGQTANVVTRTKQPLGEVPGDIALELARLDPGEVSTALTRGGALEFLMLCNRTVTESPAPTLADMKATLFNQRVTGLSDAYLDKLRAAAIITYP